MVYGSNAAGNFDIYLQSVGGQTPINLTRDATADDSQPTFSDDGERIAFRSDRDGGGSLSWGGLARVLNSFWRQHDLAT